MDRSRGSDNNYLKPKNLKERVLQLLILLGVNSLARYATRKQPRILMFHKVSLPGDPDKYFDSISINHFEVLIAYLKKNYNLMTMHQLVNYYELNGCYPNYACVITFDDGFDSFEKLVMPVLKKHQVPASLFLCPKLIDDNETIWPEYVAGSTFDSGEVNSRDEIAKKLESLKSMNSASREAVIKQLIKNGEAAAVSNDSRLMHWDAIQEISKSPLIEVGSHTLTHPILANESDAKIKEEIEFSKAILEERLGIPVFSFCYPNGQPGDFGDREIKCIKNANYKVALASHTGLVNKSSNWFALPRIGCDFDSIVLTRKYVDGLDEIQRRLAG